MEKKKKEDSLGGIIFSGFIQSVLTGVAIYWGTILVTLLAAMTIGAFSSNKEEENALE